MWAKQNKYSYIQFLIPNISITLEASSISLKVELDSEQWLPRNTSTQPLNLELTSAT